MLKMFWKWVKKVTFFIWIVFMALLGVWLAKDNGTMVAPTLLGFTLPETSLGLVICLTLLVGVLMGFLTNYLVLKPGLMANRRALKKAKLEVANLRTGFLKE